MPVDHYAGMSVMVRPLRGGEELVHSLAPEWLHLLRENAAHEPFCRPEWVLAYLRAFQPDNKLLLLTAYTGDRLQAVVPLVEKRTVFHGLPVRKLSGAANEHSCRFDLVRAAGPVGDAAVGAVWRFLRDLPDWDMIELPYVPQGAAAEMLMDAARNDGFLTGAWESLRTPVISLDTAADVSHIPPNAHFRQNLRRRMRKAQARWPVRLARHDDADPALLERFYEIERSGWKGRGATAIVCSAKTRRFYDEIASAAGRLGYFSLYLLQFGDTIVAGHYGLTYQGRYYSPKVAYDESYAPYGPGHLLVDAVLRDCLSRGVSEFDFLGTWMEWKAEWTQTVRRHADRFIFRRNLYGHALFSAQFRVRAALRWIAHQPRIARFRRRIGH